MATDTDCTPCPDGEPCGAPTIVTAGKYTRVVTVENCNEVLASKPRSILVHGQSDKPVRWATGAEGEDIDLGLLKGDVGDSVVALMALKADGTVQKFLSDPEVGFQEIVAEGGNIRFQPLGSLRTCFDKDEIPTATDEELSCLTRLGLANCGPVKCLRRIPAADPNEFFIPAGSIVMWGGIDDPPDDWANCNGTPLDPLIETELFEVIGYNYGRTGDFFLTPDFRGVFPRGTDNGKGEDPEAAARTASGIGGAIGDAPGSFQEDAFQFHDHGILVYAPRPAIQAGSGAAFNYVDSFTDGTPATDPLSTPEVFTNTIEDPAVSSLNETRPKNLGVNFIISLGTPK